MRASVAISSGQVSRSQSTKSRVAPPAGSAAGDATNKLDHSGRIYVKRTRRKKVKLKNKEKVFAAT
jgi:hypothetical protein